MKTLLREIMTGIIMMIYFFIIFSFIFVFMTGCSSNSNTIKHISTPNTYIEGATSINEQIDHKIVLLQKSR